jgi:hypothetical protein
MRIDNFAILPPLPLPQSLGANRRGFSFFRYRPEAAIARWRLSEMLAESRM